MFAYAFFHFIASHSPKDVILCFDECVQCTYVLKIHDINDPNALFEGNMSTDVHF